MLSLKKASFLLAVALSCPVISEAQCHLFFTEPVAGKVYSMASHTGLPQAIIEGVPGPRDIEVDLINAKLYFAADDGNIYRSSLDGSSLNVIASGILHLIAIALDPDSGKLYWGTSTGEIVEADLDGSHVRTLYTQSGAIIGLGVATSPYIDRTKMLVWSEKVQNSAYLRTGNISTPSDSPLDMLTLLESANKTYFAKPLVLNGTWAYWGSMSIEGAAFGQAAIVKTGVVWNSPAYGTTVYLQDVLNNRRSMCCSIPSSLSDIEFGDDYVYFSDEDAFPPAVHRTGASGAVGNYVTRPGMFTPYGIAVVPTASTSVCQSLEVPRSALKKTTVWRPNIGGWYLRRPINGFDRDADLDALQWGLPGDNPILLSVYSEEDVAVWRPNEGNWYICQTRSPWRASSPAVAEASCDIAPIQFGLPGDYPLSGDFDGDGKSDLVVWRPTTGMWYIRNSSSLQASTYQWGLPGDLPVPADYDGDGVPELAVWRPATGNWYIRYSTQSYDPARATVRQWGLPQDHPMTGDFTGDGKAELAVWRPESGMWFICDIAHNPDCSQGTAVQWGLPGDSPISEDFDNDGRLDYVVWRPESGVWFFRSSANDAVFQQQWGLGGDVPLIGGIRERALRLYGALR